MTQIYNIDQGKYEKRNLGFGEIIWGIIFVGLALTTLLLV